MGYKQTDPCLKKVADDEPIFVLRAQDMSAPATIEHWLSLNPQLSEERKREAREIARRMRQWPKRRRAD